MSDAEIICERQGSAGLITLNRPQALNALTLDMVRAMRRALDAWESDPAVTRIVVTGAGEKAFCAGGDIRKLYDLGKEGRQAEALTFWREEYELNIRIKRYTKPYVALIDGIVMGGGVGVSLHGSHRVAGERIVFAMPEVGIGFFPDVGATYALPRLPDRDGHLYRADGRPDPRGRRPWPRACDPRGPLRIHAPPQGGPRGRRTGGARSRTCIVRPRSRLPSMPIVRSSPAALPPTPSRRFWSASMPRRATSRRRAPLRSGRSRRRACPWLSSRCGGARH